MQDPPITHRLVDAFRWVDLAPTSSHLVSDVSGWWRDPRIVAQIGPALAGLFAGEPPPTVVVAPEKGGFIVGPLVASALGVGFVEAYKNTRKRQIADRLVWRSTGPDYRGRELSLGLRARHLGATDRVLLVDDWAETGAQLGALRKIVFECGAQYAGAAVIVDACPPAVCESLQVRSLIRGPELDARLP